MAFDPPNQMIRNGNVGHSSQPPAGPSYTDGRIMGSNEANRFGVAAVPANQFPPAAIEPGKGAVPVSPFQSGSGLPSRIDASIPDMAGISKPGFR